MRMRDDAFQCTFQFTHIGADTLRNKEGNIWRQQHIGLLGFLHQNCDPGFQLGRFNRHRQTPAKARFKPLFHTIDFLRIAVAGQDHLLAAFQ